MGGCDKFPQVVVLCSGVCLVVYAEVSGSVRVGRIGTFFGGQGCCWVRFRGLNFAIRLGLRDSGAHRILVVKRVLKLNKGTKHWRVRAFVSIAARVW